MARWSIVAVLVTLAAVPAWAQSPDARCDQVPGNRFFWVEPAFCDLAAHGPGRALGVILWNHGLHATVPQYTAPVPPAFRLLHARGWDVLAIKRNNLAEGDTDRTLPRAVGWNVEEAAAQRKLGYAAVVVAGQSFGGYIALESINTTSDFTAAVAMAPGVRPLGAGNLDPSVTDRLLKAGKTGRLAVLFPKNDTFFGSRIRGPNAVSILGSRDIPYLLIDETSEISGHGGGTTGQFAMLYGACLAEFLSARDMPGGRFRCPAPADHWPAVRQLALPRHPPSVVKDAGTLPPTIGSLTGWWYGLMEDVLVAFALVRDGEKLRAAYRVVNTRAGGGVYDASVKEGRVTAVLSSKATVVVTPRGQEAEITWTSADGARVMKGTLVRGAEAE